MQALQQPAAWNASSAFVHESGAVAQVYDRERAFAPLERGLRDYAKKRRSRFDALRSSCLVATSDLTRVLDRAEVSYELLPHAHTESALAEAEALGVAPEDVAKTLVVKTAGGYLRAVLPASARLDLRKLREIHGGGRHTLHLATEDDLRRDYPEFELGAVPPLGGRSDPVIVDPKVAERTSAVIEAGSHNQSLRLAAADLVHLTGATVTDISED
jgi:Ala-tRNA(Pro) deacylase